MEDRIKTGRKLNDVQRKNHSDRFMNAFDRFIRSYQPKRERFIINWNIHVTLEHKSSHKSLGIFVAISKNTLYESKLLILL